MIKHYICYLIYSFIGPLNIYYYPYISSENTEVQKSLSNEAHDA